MNSFDFSIYDPDDQTVVSVKAKEPEPETKKQKEKPKVAAFDFGQYDYDEPSPKKETTNKKSKNPLETKPVSKEDYAKMSMSEKIQYAKDLEKEQRYEFSKGFTKNVASGATFGASENIPGFQLEEDDDKVASGFGQVVGSVIPIGGSAKVVSIPVKAAFKHAPKILQPLRHLMQAFGTGATYESGKQGVNAASGKEVDFSQIPKTGAEFATVDAVLRGGGALAKKFLKLSPVHQAQILEQQIIPSDLPKSQYETAAEMLELVKKQPQQNQTFPGFPGGEPSSGFSPTAPLNRNRITKPQDIGLRPSPQPSKHSKVLQDEIGDIFSKNKFYNTTEGGKAFKNEIMNIDEDVYRGVNELYKNSRELNSTINEIHPQLVSKLETRVAELKEIPEPSDVQKRLIRAQNKILDKLVEYETVKDEAGNIIDNIVTGYKPVNNQTIIDQVQSLRQIIDYDFAHGNTKNIFKPLINDLQDSALRAAESSGNSEAAEALNEARAAYRSWAEAFDNDYVRPFRDSSNQDFSKLFKSALDFDESNMLRKILNISENGQQLSKASQREIVEKHLSKFFENPRTNNQREFDKTLRELEAVITPDESKAIREKFNEVKKRIDIRAKQAPKRAQTNDELIASRYEGNKPEDIQNMMNSRSGIKQLREDFSDSKIKKEVFERLSKQKIRSILREGNIEKEFTGDDLYKFLNKEKNYELLSEILGESETEMLRQSAKEIGKAQVKSEVRKKNITKAAHKVAAYKTFEVLLGLL